MATRNIARPNGPYVVTSFHHARRFLEQRPRLWPLAGTKSHKALQEPGNTPEEVDVTHSLADFGAALERRSGFLQFAALQVRIADVVPGVGGSKDFARLFRSLGNGNHVLQLAQRLLPLPQQPQRNAVQVQRIRQRAQVARRPPQPHPALGSQQLLAIGANVEVHIRQGREQGGIDCWLVSLDLCQVRPIE
jgi:hypothetical protein